jgi:Zn-dependent alcohol dehydrogenase
VNGFQLGDRVADMTVLGSNATYRTLRVDHLTRVPTRVDAVEAAALILSWMTAYQLLHRAARVQRGQRVLAQGAAGAVGQALLTLGSMGDRARRARRADSRARHHADRLPTGRLHACPAGRVRHRLRRHRRGRLSPLLRSAQARRPGADAAAPARPH